MTHRFPIKEIAAQAGISTATVDRAINKRAHVSPQTKVRVTRALKELENQEMLLSATGRRLFFDFIVEAPERFSSEVHNALNTAAPEIGNAVCRSRFIANEYLSDDDLIDLLKKIKTRGSHGVCLKVRDTPRINRAINDLGVSGVPIVTLVTDVKDIKKLAYVGLDNPGAGKTAAYLIEKVLGNQSATVLTTQSNKFFAGETDRENSFEKLIKKNTPEIKILKIKGGGGLGRPTESLVYDAVQNLNAVDGVYSMGGGNRSIISALDNLGFKPKIFIAHDLDKDNRELLIQKKLHFVLNHDLVKDLRQVFNSFLYNLGLSTPQPYYVLSDVNVITPFNIPEQKLISSTP